MPLPKENNITYEEFLEIDSKTDEYLEFIDGRIFSHASPSTNHQAILVNLSTEFGIYFKGKTCRHFVAPYDVLFKGKNEIHRAQPDLLVVCDKSGYQINSYEGVPSLIVEILSPSTASNDFIIKMGLYMRFGVKEYWIVSPVNKEIQVFILNEEGNYTEPISYKNGIISSNPFPDLKINVNDIFEL